LPAEPPLSYIVPPQVVMVPFEMLYVCETAVLPEKSEANKATENSNNPDKFSKRNIHFFLVVFIPIH
jgi:hypothetical protein